MSGPGNEPLGQGERGAVSPLISLARGANGILEWSGRLIVFACLVTMFLALLINVILRYAFGTGIPWAYEIHAVLLPWLVAGGLVIASAKGRNIAVTLVADRMKGRAAFGLHLVNQAIILIISTSVLWSSQPILKASQFQTLSTLGLKQIWGYSSLAYAFGAMALIAMLGICRTLAGDDTGELALQDKSLS